MTTMKHVTLTAEETKEFGLALQTGDGSKYVRQLAIKYEMNPEKTETYLEVGCLYPVLQGPPELTIAP